MTPSCIKIMIIFDTNLYGMKRGFSSVGRASALHAEGQGFDSPNLQVSEYKASSDHFTAASSFRVTVQFSHAPPTRKFAIDFIVPHRNVPFRLFVFL
jgi:hypothetical protein